MGNAKLENYSLILLKVNYLISSNDNYSNAKLI